MLCLLTPLSVAVTFQTKGHSGIRQLKLNLYLFIISCPVKFKHCIFVKHRDQARHNMLFLASTKLVNASFSSGFMDTVWLRSLKPCMPMNCVKLHLIIPVLMILTLFQGQKGEGISSMFWIGSCPV